MDNKFDYQAAGFKRVEKVEDSLKQEKVSEEKKEARFFSPTKEHKAIERFNKKAVNTEGGWTNLKEKDFDVNISAVGGWSDKRNQNLQKYRENPTTSVLSFEVVIFDGKRNALLDESMSVNSAGELEVQTEERWLWRRFILTDYTEEESGYDSKVSVFAIKAEIIQGKGVRLHWSLQPSSGAANSFKGSVDFIC